MINVLVVSDNLTLMKFFKREILREDISGIAVFEFRYSMANKSPEDLVAIGMTPIDLKDLHVCNKIIGDFDLVLSLHCKQIFPKELVCKVRCINFHPGLNPHNRGWYPQVFSIINKKPIGVTIHVMDEFVDHGMIIYQQELKVLPVDTSLTLYNKVVELEKRLISKNLRQILINQYEVSEPSVEGNYNSIEDFKKLCELDLTSEGTLQEHIDLLRALTHGSFKNAFFYENGKKVYVSIDLIGEGS